MRLRPCPKGEGELDERRATGSNRHPRCWREVTPAGYHRFWRSAVIASLAVEQLEVTGPATSKLPDVRLGRPAAQDVALGGDWARQIR